MRRIWCSDWLVGAVRRSAACEWRDRRQRLKASDTITFSKEKSVVGDSSDIQKSSAMTFRVIQEN